MPAAVLFKSQPLPVMLHPLPPRIHSNEKPQRARQSGPMLSIRKRKSVRKSLPAFYLLMGTHEASRHPEPCPAPRGDEARREGYGFYQIGLAAAAPGDRRGDLRETYGCPADIAAAVDFNFQEFQGSLICVCLNGIAGIRPSGRNTWKISVCLKRFRLEYFGSSAHHSAVSPGMEIRQSLLMAHHKTGAARMHEGVPFIIRHTPGPV